MSAPILKAGASGPQRTKISKSISDKNQTVVTIEGLYTALDAADPADYVPDGLTLESSQLSSSGDGMGVLTLSCRAYDDHSATNLAPIRTTIEVEMEETVYDLEDHPSLRSVRPTIILWLATDEKEREDGGHYFYRNKSGMLLGLVADLAIKFCEAYMAGIKTFTRYFPVISKKSIWRNPPGLERSGRSFNGGSVPFSANCGKFDEPPIELNGFPKKNYFKGPENWTQNENKTWTQTEKWTYTPDGSDGPHAWIYEVASSGNNQPNNGNS